MSRDPFDVAAMEPAERDAFMAAWDRYEKALHAMQTGVKAEMVATHDQGDFAATSPKHLRVGVNNALVIHSALVGLLIGKGIFTEVEYAEAIAEAMEAEKALYEHRVGRRLL